MRLLRLLQTIDRRVLYALLLFSVLAPFFFTLKLPVPITSQTKGVYDAIEGLPAGSFVLFGVDWSAGTRGENGAQTEALMRHLMKRKLRFGLLAFDPQSKTLSEDIALRIQGDYGAKEGVDWVNFGYKSSDVVNFLKAFVKDIPAAVPTDIHGKTLTDLEVMKGVRSARDIKFLLDVTPSATYEAYIQFVQGPYQIPMGLGPTAVMAPEAFNYLDSKQLVGMLNGLQGAIEYEQKVGVVGKATRASISLSFAHLLLIAFIVMGNVAMILERRQAARLEKGETP